MAEQLQVHDSRISDIEGLLKQILAGQFLTEKDHALISDRCRTEIFAEVANCQLDLKNDVSHLRRSQTAVEASIGAITRSIQEMERKRDEAKTEQNDRWKSVETVLRDIARHLEAGTARG